MYTHSFTARAIRKTSAALEACCRGSKTASLLEGAQIRLAAWFAGSMLTDRLWHNDVSWGAWRGSLFYRLFIFAQNIIKKILVAVSCLYQASIENSLAGKTWRFLLKRLYLQFVLAGLLAAAALVLFRDASALLYPAAAAAGILVLKSPTCGLFLFILAMPFLPNTLLLPLAGLVGVSFVLSRLRGGHLYLWPLPVEPALSLYLFIAAAATAASVYTGGSMRDLAMYASAFILFIVLINQLHNRKKLTAFLNIALIGALFVSLYGIYQYIVGAPMLPGWVDPAQNPFIRTRAYSVFGNPNVLAKYLVMLVPFAAALFFAAKCLWAKLFYLGAAGIMTLTLLLTFSRGGWMGLAAGLVVFALLKDRRVLILILVAILAGTAVMPEAVLQRIGTIGSPRDTSNAYRFAVWQESLLIIRDFPLTGVGLGHRAFMRVYPFYMLTRDKRPFHSHNSYLQMLLETGIIGLLAFLWLLAGSVKRGLKAAARLRDPVLKHVVMASLAALAGILIQGLGDVVIYMPKITILFWLTCALIFLCIRLDDKNRGTAEFSP